MLVTYTDTFLLSEYLHGNCLKPLTSQLPQVAGSQLDILIEYQKNFFPAFLRKSRGCDFFQILKAVFAEDFKSSGM
jgi:hypothetical protein